MAARIRFGRDPRLLPLSLKGYLSRCQPRAANDGWPLFFSPFRVLWHDHRRQ